MLKKAFIVACAAVLLSLVLSRLSLFPSLRREYTPDPVKYTISEYRGMVAVFRREENRPFQILYSYVKSLPADLAKKLERGISVRSERELVKMLEKLSS